MFSVRTMIGGKTAGPNGRANRGADSSANRDYQAGWTRRDRTSRRWAVHGLHARRAHGILDRLCLASQRCERSIQHCDLLCHDPEVGTESNPRAAKQ